MDILTREQVRAIDRRAVDEYEMSGLVLMENAGRGCADLLCRLGVEGTAVICCGKGNNAGDGFVIARHLELRNQPVKVLLWSDPDQLQGDAAANYRILTHCDVPRVVFGVDHNADRLEQELQGARWIVDCLLGTGARGAPRAPLDQVIEQLNRHGARKLAVDVPSGLDCDTGEAAGVVFQADHTCTFVAAKPGLIASQAAQWVGQLHVADIGVPRRLVWEARSTEYEARGND